MLYLNELIRAIATRVNDDEQGQGLTEYGLIIALVAVGCVALLTGLGGQLQGVFGNITGQLAPGV